MVVYMATRKPSDPVPSPSLITHTHLNRKWKIGEKGGARNGKTIVRFYINHQKWLGVWWDKDRNYILVPWSAWRQVGYTGQIEFVDDRPPHESTQTVFYHDTRRIRANEERWDLREMTVAAIPRHILHRYQYLKYGDGMKWRKAQVKRTDIPCDCYQCWTWSDPPAGPEERVAWLLVTKLGARPISRPQAA